MTNKKSRSEARPGATQAGQTRPADTTTPEPEDEQPTEQPAATGGQPQPDGEHTVQVDQADGEHTVQVDQADDTADDARTEALARIAGGDDPFSPVEETAPTGRVDAEPNGNTIVIDTKGDRYIVNAQIQPVYGPAGRMILYRGDTATIKKTTAARLVADGHLTPIE